MSDSKKQEVIVQQDFGWLKDITGNKEDSPLDIELAEITKETRTKSKYGFVSSVPMICKGEECPIKSQCPLFKNNKHPINTQCPLELDSLEQHILSYAKEFNLSPDIHSELILLTELAECIVLEDRATKMLPSDLLLKQERYSAQGDLYEEVSLHPLNILKEKYKSRRLKILESFMGTRKEKMKAVKAVKQLGDYGSSLANLKERLEKYKSIKNDKETVAYDDE